MDIDGLGKWSEHAGNTRRADLKRPLLALATNPPASCAEQAPNLSRTRPEEMISHGPQCTPFLKPCHGTHHPSPHGASQRSRAARVCTNGSLLSVSVNDSCDIPRLGFATATPAPPATLGLWVLLPTPTPPPPLEDAEGGAKSAEVQRCLELWGGGGGGAGLVAPRYVTPNERVNILDLIPFGETMAPSDSKKEFLTNI